MASDTRRPEDRPKCRLYQQVVDGEIDPAIYVRFLIDTAEVWANGRIGGASDLDSARHLLRKARFVAMRFGSPVDEIDQAEARITAAGEAAEDADRQLVEMFMVGQYQPAMPADLHWQIYQLGDGEPDRSAGSRPPGQITKSSPRAMSIMAARIRQGILDGDIAAVRPPLDQPEKKVEKSADDR